MTQPAVYDDAKEIALEAAATLMAGERFAKIACVSTDVDAAHKVTDVADVFVAWLRRLRSAQLGPATIEEIDTGEIVRVTGENEMTNIDTSQRARYPITGVVDDRGFPIAAEGVTLAGRSSDEAVATVAYIESTDAGNVSGGDELLATFAGTTGTATIELYDPANPTVVLAADVLVANPGNVAAASLGTPVIEEIPAP